MEVCYLGRTVGRVQVEVQADGVRFTSECRVQTDQILRLYGLRDGCAPLRIDVAEPAGEGLHVGRMLSWHALRAAGYTADCLPTRYVLDAGDGSGLADRSVTGDSKLDALIARGAASCQAEGQSFRVQVPFAPGKACPLAFALTACTVTDGQAILCIKSVRSPDAPFQAGEQVVE